MAGGAQEVVAEKGVEERDAAAEEEKFPGSDFLTLLAQQSDRYEDCTSNDKKEKYLRARLIEVKGELLDLQIAKDGILRALSRAKNEATRKEGRARLEQCKNAELDVEDQIQGLEKGLMGMSKEEKQPEKPIVPAVASSVKPAAMRLKKEELNIPEKFFDEGFFKMSNNSATFVRQMNSIIRDLEERGFSWDYDGFMLLRNCIDPSAHSIIEQAKVEKISARVVLAGLVEQFPLREAEDKFEKALQKVILRFDDSSSQVFVNQIEHIVEDYGQQFSASNLVKIMKRTDTQI